MGFSKQSGKKGLPTLKFGGGKAKTSVSPPNKKVLESYGGAKSKAPMFEARTQGNRETGFIQSTPKKATGAMMGRAPPPLIGGKMGGSPRADSKKQFKAKAGRKVF